MPNRINSSAGLASPARFRWLVIAGIGVGCLVFVGATALDIWADYRRTIQASESQAQSLARALEEHIAGSLREVDRVLLYFLQPQGGADAIEGFPPEAIYHALRARIADLPQVDNAFVVNSEGVAVVSSLRFPFPRVYVGDRDYFVAQRDNPATGLFISTPMNSRTPEVGRFVGVSRRIEGPDGGFGGIVVVALRLSYFDSFYESLDLGPGSLIAILHTRGCLLFRAPHLEDMVGRDLSSYPLFTTHLPQSPVGVFRNVSVADQVERLFAYRQVAHLPLVVEVGLGMDEVLAPWRERAGRMVLEHGAVLLVLLVLMGLVLVQFSRTRLFASELGVREGRLRTVLDTVADAIVTIDQGGVVRSANAAIEAAFGYRVEEILGTPVARLIPGWAKEHPDFVLRPGVAEQSASAPRSAVETEGQRKDGSRFPVEVSLGWGHEAGEVRTTAVIRDITTRKQVDEALRRGQRMEVVGQLTGGIAHDFNNLLGIIVGNLDLLDGQVGDETAQRRLRTAIKAALRGADLTRRLLSFARGRAGATAPTDLNAIIRSMDEMLQRSLTTVVEVELILAEPLWLTAIDAGDFEDVVLNLALNARDAMPQGGRLSIETANVALDGDYAVQNPGLVPGDYVVVAVSDTGVGMTKETLERAFEPFFTTKSEAKGSGLGLSMVYGFARRSLGNVKLYSEPGHGTVVRLYLPRAADADVQNRPHETAEPALPGGHETVLVVDDEDDLRMIAVEFLQTLGYRTLAASDGAEALAMVAGNEPIDFLFSDVVMPGGMNGQELAEQAKVLRPELAILLTSGFPRNGTRSPKGNLKLPILPKPYRRADLAQWVRRLLDERRGR